MLIHKLNIICSLYIYIYMWLDYNNVRCTRVILKLKENIYILKYAIVHTCKTYSLLYSSIRNCLESISGNVLENRLYYIQSKLKTFLFFTLTEHSVYSLLFTPRICIEFSCNGA